MKVKSNYDAADADKTKSQNKLLNNKTVMSKLNKTQQKALKAGKTVVLVGSFFFKSSSLASDSARLE